jgi:hypothetical protein
MAPRRDPSPHLRRSANRTAVRGTEPSDRLLAAADAGVLSRHNTRAGTKGRQAVDRVTYLRRRAGYPDLTARQALGHPAAGDRLPTISLMAEGPARYLVLEGLSRRDAKRAGKYNDLVNRLSTGRMTPEAFRGRIRTWRPIAGYRFLAEPDAVFAILDDLRAQDVEPFYYDSGRS